MNSLILGDGLLGSEIRKQTDWNYISREKDNIDFNDLYSYAHFLYDYDTIINCIGYTKTYIESRDENWETNFISVCNLVDYCNRKEKKLVHISTDYIYSGSNSFASEKDVPVHCRTWYGYTKLLGDGYVQGRCNEYLLIRTSFKPFPFPYPSAITTQRGNFDYVNVISGYIIKLIEANASGIFNVGTDTKTIYDLASRTAKVQPLDEVIHQEMPRDITMNTGKMRNFLYGRY